MLKISDLQAKVDDQIIINDLNIHIQKGEVHAIMGPNGAGKSTLAQVIAGNDNYTPTKGSIKFNDTDLLQLTVDERARKGIFMGFQYPVEIPGVSWLNFLKAAVNSKRKEQKLKDVNAADFFRTVKEKAKILSIDENFLKRSVNDGFSGGEKKKLEILQMLLLDPELIILDELDSGLDVDALKLVTRNVAKYNNKEKNSVLIITHYQRILRYIKPDFIHIFYNGTIIKSGDFSLAEKIEEYGYEQFLVAR